jgi:hypothetical protein
VFLRKMLVVVLPLLMCLLLSVLFPFLGKTFPDLNFFEYVIEGLLLGAALALLIPLMGGRKREPFAGLFWVAAVLLFLTVTYQYLYQTGAMRVEALSFLAAAGPQVVLVECTFLGFLVTAAIRSGR